MAMTPDLPSIDDNIQSPVAGLSVLEPPDGYKYGQNFLQIIPINPTAGGVPEVENNERMPTARDQALVVLKTQRDPIPVQLLDIPRRFALTADDFGIHGDPKEVAMLAMNGDGEAFSQAARTLYLYLRLMDEDKIERTVTGPNGLPHRSLLKNDEKTGRPIYAPARKYISSRWAVDAYSGMGVKDGMRPLEGFYQELVVAAWLTHIFPNIMFARRGVDLTGFEVTEQAMKKADARLDPEKSIKRKRSLAWMEAAKKLVDAKLPKGEAAKGGKK